MKPKIGGRQKGTPNVITTELRSVMKAFISSELEQIHEHLDALTPIQRIDVLIKLMPYVMPKVEPINHDRGEPMQWDINTQ